MYTVELRKGEEIDRVLKRLKSKVIEDGLMDELYRLRAHETPRDKRKRKEKLMYKKAKMQKR